MRGQRDYEADLCTNLRPALLQALQRLSVENMDHGLGQGHTAQGKRHKLKETEYIDLQKYYTNTCCIPKERLFLGKNLCSATISWLKFIEIDEMRCTVMEEKLIQCNVTI